MLSSLSRSCFYYVCFFCVILVYFFFFFKQKTAYEMRISDWSSDVCFFRSKPIEIAEQLIDHIRPEQGVSWILQFSQGTFQERKIAANREEHFRVDRKSTRLNSSH